MIIVAINAYNTGARRISPLGIYHPAGNKLGIYKGATPHFSLSCPNAVAMDYARADMRVVLAGKESVKNIVIP
ncbi:MAG: hypothetical protein WCX64_05550 [Candidatus Micrarchaeia archaeon]